MNLKHILKQKLAKNKAILGLIFINLIFFNLIIASLLYLPIPDNLKSEHDSDQSFFTSKIARYEKLFDGTIVAEVELESSLMEECISKKLECYIYLEGNYPEQNKAASPLVRIIAKEIQLPIPSVVLEDDKILEIRPVVEYFDESGGASVAFGDYINMTISD
jgi:hypothetical protein